MANESVQLWDRLWCSRCERNCLVKNSAEGMFCRACGAKIEEIKSPDPKEPISTEEPEPQTGELGAHPAWIRYECPTCGAAAGNLCVTAGFGNASCMARVLLVKSPSPVAEGADEGKPGMALARDGIVRMHLGTLRTYQQYMPPVLRKKYVQILDSLKELL